MLGRGGPARMGKSESRQGQVADRMLHRSRNADQHGKAGKPDVGLRHIDARGRLVIKLARLGIEIPYPGYVERSEEQTSELQSLMRSSSPVFCLKKKTHIKLLERTD